MINQKLMILLNQINYLNKSISKQKTRIQSHHLSKDNRNNNNHDLKSNLLYTQKKMTDENHHQSKWVYHEFTKTEGTTCSKMCNGIHWYRLYPVCMNNQNKVDDHMCLNEKAKPMYIEKPCNTDCRLQ
jgi:hypothetical protein